MKRLIIWTRDWYARYERPLSSASLVGGFVFDAVTLKRVDLFWENLWVIAHFVIVGVCIILVNLQENEAMDNRDASKAHFWYINTLQFFFGGLLSTFIVFYFRSTTLAATWPFLLLLGAAFWANEALKKHYARLTFQISLFFLSLFAFAVFIVPIFSHRIGTDVFLVSGLMSLVALWLYLAALKFFAREKFKASRRMLVFSVGSIYLATNLLYFLNLIPPIPLSLKDGGIYHAIERDESGNYLVVTEDAGWFGHFVFRETIHVAPGAPVYAYSAIFSPTSFSTDIIHEWERYDESAGAWVVSGRVKLATLGGRDGGYRTYSMKTNVSAGEWRVNVETSRGQIIGRLRFTVARTDTPAPLKTEVKD